MSKRLIMWSAACICARRRLAQYRANPRRHDLELKTNLNTNRFGILFAYVNDQGQREKREIRHFIGRRTEKSFHAGGRRARRRERPWRARRLSIHARRLRYDVQGPFVDDEAIRRLR